MCFLYTEPLFLPMGPYMTWMGQEDHSPQHMESSGSPVMTSLVSPDTV